jgi:hypothetical protein
MTTQVIPTTAQALASAPAGLVVWLGPAGKPTVGTLEMFHARSPSGPDQATEAEWSAAVEGAKSLAHRGAGLVYVVREA